jgi:hypothetical protein
LLALPLLADEARIEGYKTQLRTVRPPELAREAARLASGANADVADVVTAASSINSPATHLVVGSVAKASPKSAGAAAAAAVASQPKLTSAIVKAAVSAAPAQLSAIVSESCKARPSLFYTLPAAVTASPSSDRIIPAVIEGVPALKPVIERAQKDFKRANRSASLALVLGTREYSRDLSGTKTTAEEFCEGARMPRSRRGSRPGRIPRLSSAAFRAWRPPSEVPAPETAEQNPTNRNYSAP